MVHITSLLPILLTGISLHVSLSPSLKDSEAEAWGVYWSFKESTYWGTKVVDHSSHMVLLCMTQEESALGLHTSEGILQP